MSPVKQATALDQHKNKIVKWINLGWTNAEIVKHLRDRHKVTTNAKSLDNALKRWNVVRPKDVERPGVKFSDEAAEIISKPSLYLSSPEDLIKERGLQPEEWEVANLTINEWDSPTGEILHQLKVNLRRLTPIHMVVPARVPGDYKRKVRVARPSKTKPRLVLLCGDQQAPFQQPKLHELFLQWLDRNKPDEGILIGDTMDFPDISRHPSNPEWAATTQECVDAAYLLLRDYVQASEATKWIKLAGNHDERLRRAIIDRLSDIYGLRKAQVPGTGPDSPLLDIPNLLRLDELGIEYVQPNGGYNHAQVKLSDFLAARHGWVARQGSGASALATLKHLGYSVLVGHTHRLSEVFLTVHDIDGTPKTLTAVETGCMCEIKNGLGYTVAPDWQNGFATAMVWPDGFFSIDLARFVQGQLLYRDQRYS